MKKIILIFLISCSTLFSPMGCIGNIVQNNAPNPCPSVPGSTTEETVSSEPESTDVVEEGITEAESKPSAVETPAAEEDAQPDECDPVASTCPTTAAPAEEPSAEEPAETPAKESTEQVTKKTMTFEELWSMLTGGRSDVLPDSEKETASKVETPSRPADQPKETATSPTASDVRTQVYDIVNSERQKNGLSALTYRSDLQAAADLRAREIVQYFSHTRPNGTSCFTVVSEAGISYRALGENIAYGQRSASEVMNGWMNSSGHRANILSSNFTGVAVGYYEQNGVKYWVQIFIR